MWKSGHYHEKLLRKACEELPCQAQHVRSQQSVVENIVIHKLHNFDGKTERKSLLLLYCGPCVVENGTVAIDRQNESYCKFKVVVT